jgi:cell volume regulation protein A
VPDTTPFAIDILLAGAAGLAVLLAHRLSRWSRIPVSAIVLALTAAVAAGAGLHRPSEHDVARVVTAALVVVLFSGGLGMGFTRFRAAAAPILVLGVAGTFGTAAAGTAFVHYALGVAWYPSALLATAVAPTDPTVVFSVLGRTRLAGPSGAILEGESGANDPVGIALMAGLIGAGALSWRGAAHVAATFAEQMAIGSAVGVAGGAALLWLAGRVHMPGRQLEPLRTLVSAFFLFGVATVAHGSGFLAVFVAGIVLGGRDIPHREEVEQFHDALASLGEMAAFVALGLTVHLGVLSRGDVWASGLALAAVLAAVLRPAFARLSLLPYRLPAAERRFVQFAGLKGAVPILLGGYILTSGVAHSARLYGIVIIVVIFSVVVQGGLVGPAIHRLRVPVEEPGTPG